MLTFSGIDVDILNFKPEYVNINDIAHSLSLQCRYNGHCKYFYSVSLHCYLLSLVVPDEYALDALMHDAGEAYMGDIIADIRALFPDIDKYEAAIVEVIAKKYGYNPVMPQAIVELDIKMRNNEKLALYDLNEEQKANLGDLVLTKEGSPLIIDHSLTVDAEHLFLDRFYQLTNHT